MRCMNRNKVRFFYALYEGREFITDEYGNVTGEYEVKCSNPTEFRANISPAMGETLTRQFGDSVSYDKIIVTVLFVFCVSSVFSRQGCLYCLCV